MKSRPCDGLVTCLGYAQPLDSWRQAQAPPSNLARIGGYGQWLDGQMKPGVFKRPTCTPEQKGSTHEKHCIKKLEFKNSMLSFYA